MGKIEGASAHRRIISQRRILPTARNSGAVARAVDIATGNVLIATAYCGIVVGSFVLKAAPDGRVRRTVGNAASRPACDRSVLATNPVADTAAD